MASYEFPNNSNTNSNEVNVVDSSSFKVKQSIAGEPVKVTWANGTPLTAEEMENYSDEIKDAIEELEEKEEERQRKREELWKNVKEGLSDVTDKVTDVGTDVGEHVSEEVFGSGFFVRHLQDVFGKTIRKIADTLKNISNFLFRNLGFALKWIKTKLVNGFTKIIKILNTLKMFALISKLFSGIGSLFSGGIDLVGNLTKGLIGGLLTSAGYVALKAGLKSLGLALASITGPALLGAIATAIVGLSGFALKKTYDMITNNMKAQQALKDYDNGKMNIPEEVLMPRDGESQKEYDKRIAEYADTHQNKKDESNKERYERFIKEYPSVARDLGFDSPWWGQDKDKNGWKDYNEDRWEELKNAIRDGNKGIDSKWTRGLSESTKEELKRKTILKNSADGVNEV